MAYQIYATIVGAKQGTLKGEGTTTGPEKDKIPGVGFEYGITVPHDAATGASSGKRQQQPVVFTKEWGVASPQLYQAAVTNEVLNSALFEFFLTTASGVLTLDHTFKLTNATISSIQESLHLGQSGGPIIDTRELEAITFYFQKIEIVSVTGGTSATDDWNVTV